MTRSKLSLIGICIAVLGVMLAPSSAQAVAQWLILHANGTPLDTAVLHAEVAAQLEGSHGILLTKVLTKKVEILCISEKLIGTSLEGEGKITAGSKVSYSGCITKIDGVTQVACKPRAGGEAPGTILTNELKGEIVLREVGGTKVGFIQIEPKTGETFANIELGGACAIGETLPVRGKLLLKECQNDITIHRVEHLLIEGPEVSDVWVLNKTVEHKATLDGSTFYYLTGAHAGLSWGPMLP